MNMGNMFNLVNLRARGGLIFRKAEGMGIG